MLDDDDNELESEGELLVASSDVDVPHDTSEEMLRRRRSWKTWVMRCTRCEVRKSESREKTVFPSTFTIVAPDTHPVTFQWPHGYTPRPLVQVPSQILSRRPAFTMTKEFKFVLR
jgi:hypothetical protein